MGKSTDASRAERKAKKRALEAAIPDLPGDHENAEDVEVEAKAEKKSKKRKRDDVVEDSETKKAKKEKKDKKKRKSEAAEVEAEAEEELQEEKPAKKEKNEKKEKKEGKAANTNGESVPAVANLDGEEDAPRKSKKERKAERKAAEAAAASKSTPTKAVSETNGVTPAEEKKSKKNNRNREKKRKGDSANGDTEGKAARFIVFIGAFYPPFSCSTSTNFHLKQGNLPFTTTTASIQKHFASVKPISVRHLTHKDDPKKSKGAAFVEFDGYDHMKTCLKLFHHSMFDDGISPARKINVELTYVPYTTPLSTSISQPILICYCYSTEREEEATPKTAKPKSKPRTRN
jgi:nucleolar protein 6